MTQAMTSSAGRALSILRKIVALPDDANNDPAQNIWSRHIPPTGGELNWVSRQGIFVGLLRQVIKDSRDINVESASESYVKVVEFWKWLVRTGIAYKVIDIKNQMNTGLASSLEAIDLKLQIAGRGGVLIEGKERKVHLEAIDNLIGLIKESNFEVNVKAELVAVLFHVRYAIANYNETGSEGVRKTLQELVGYIVMRMDKFSDKSSNGEKFEPNESIKTILGWARGVWATYATATAMDLLPTLGVIARQITKQ